MGDASAHRIGLLVMTRRRVTARINQSPSGDDEYDFASTVSLVSIRPHSLLKGCSVEAQMTDLH
jgi:hypothetical protein